MSSTLMKYNQNIPNKCVLKRLGGGCPNLHSLYLAMANSGIFSA